MEHLEYAVNGGDGWVNVGYVPEDGITLSVDDDSSSLPRSTFYRELSDSLELAAVDLPLPRPFEPGKIVAMKIWCCKSTRASTLRERAESMGGKFLRNYLKSQRRSRDNTGAKPYATGGLMKREVIFPRVRLENDPYHWRTS